MGSKSTKLELHKSLDDLFASTDESHQREMWNQLIESKTPLDLIMEVFTISDSERLQKTNLELYKKLILDVIYVNIDR